MWFTITGGSGGSPIGFTTYASFAPEFLTYAGTYVPEGLDGSVTQGCCEGVVGDANGVGGEEPTVSDISTIIDFLFISGSPLPCIGEADANVSGGVDPGPADITVSDISVIIDHLFITGAPLAPCP